MPNGETNPSSAMLINSYEIPRIRTKLLQTFLGGMAIGPNLNIPWFLTFQQLVIFIYPSISIVVFTTLYELNLLSEIVTGICCGCTTLAVSMAISISLIAFSFVKRYDMAERTSRVLTGDNDLQNFTSFFGIATLEFLFNMVKPVLLWILHPLLGALTVALVCTYLLPSNLVNYYSSYWISIPLYVLGLFTTCIAHYATVAKSPSEPAQFGPTDRFYMDHVTRSIYVIAFACFGLLARSYPMYEYLKLTDMILHILFVFLPAFWLFGLLPPLNALMFWFIDFILIHVCGTSPVVGIPRYLVAFSMCFLHTLTICLIDDMAIGIVFASCLACLLSLDVASLIISLCGYGITKSTSLGRSSYDISSNASCEKLNCFSSSRKQIILKAILIVVCFISSALAHPYIFLLNASNGVYIAICLGLLLYLSIRLQSRYFLFGILRNPLFASMKRIQSQRNWCSCSNVFAALYLSLSRVVVPIVMIKIVSSYLSADHRQWSSYLVRIATVRYFKSAWHYPMGCVIDVILLRISFFVNIFNNSSDNYSVLVKLMIIAFVRLKFHEFFQKMKMVILLTYHAIRDSKQRHRLAIPFASLSLLLIPLVLFIIAIAAILSAPLIPLFTLPLFIIGFPRPQSFWPSAEERQHTTTNNDWIYYKHAEDSVVAMMNECCFRGKLGLVCPGDMFLLRFQDRFIWVSVAESGFMYNNLITKGLELQETSCHAIEAADVDDMFQECLLNDKTPCFNIKYVDRVLTPKDVGSIYTYSDAKNVLTGIIDQKGFSKKVGKMFLKTLLWLTLRHCMLKSSGEHSQIPSSRFTLNNIVSKKVAVLLDSRRTDNNINQSQPHKKDSTVGSYHAKLSEKSITSTADLIDNETNIDVNDDETNYGLPATDQYSTKCVGLKNSIKHNAQEMVLKSIKINIGTDREDGEGDDFEDFGFDDENDNIADKTPPTRKISSVSDNSSQMVQLRPGIGGRKVSRVRSNSDIVSSLSKYIDLPVNWKRCFSGSLSGLMPMTVKFPVSWYKFILESFELHQLDKSLNQNALLDQSVMSPFCQFVMWCYFIVEVAPYSKNDDQEMNEIQHMLRCYQCDFPWSVHLHHLTKDKVLSQLVPLAYRYAFKIVLDECVLGDKTDFNELNDALIDFDTNWHIGSDDCKDWADAVDCSTPHLFTIGHNPLQGTVSSRTLSLQQIPVAIGSLQTEMVKSIWASSVLELLYLTNDDDERYSIQSHPAILRNLTVQASDPPIGYPIFSSGLISRFSW